MNRPLIRLPLRATGTTSVRKWLKWGLAAALLLALALAARFVPGRDRNVATAGALSLRTDARRRFFRRRAVQVDSIRFPQADKGPYDSRLGYALLPSFQQRLLERGFEISAQARDSERMLSLADNGLFMPYEEKDQAGLQLFDGTGAPLFGAQYPGRVYDELRRDSAAVVNSLLFIEDRYLLDPDQPNRNPAIDWGRFSRALVDQGARVFNQHQSTPGGSTLATQIEKFRHSAGGRTATPPEKLRQIASASVRAYLNGPQTHARAPADRRALSELGAARRAAGHRRNQRHRRRSGRLVRTRFQRRQPHPDSAVDTKRISPEQGVAFRQVLSLMIAQRAPSYFLHHGYAELERLTDSYLRLLASGGVDFDPAARCRACPRRSNLHRAPARTHDRRLVRVAQGRDVDALASAGGARHSEFLRTRPARSAGNGHARTTPCSRPSATGSPPPRHATARKPRASSATKCCARRTIRRKSPIASRCSNGATARTSCGCRPTA